MSKRTMCSFDGLTQFILENRSRDGYIKSQIMPETSTQSCNNGSLRVETSGCCWFWNKDTPSGRSAHQRFMDYTSLHDGFMQIRPFLELMCYILFLFLNIDNFFATLHILVYYPKICHTL